MAFPHVSIAPERPASQAGKYRKRPVVISARRAVVQEQIETLEGIMTADVGDWIITGIKGEQYPCKPDIFERCYEPADETGVDEWRLAYGEESGTATPPNPGTIEPPNPG